MIYIDYKYYKNQYRGNAVTEEDFPRLSIQASAILDAITFGNIKIVSDEVKMACCAIMDEARAISDIPIGVQSERVGPWSATYDSNVRGNQEQRYRDAAAVYLANTGLLFRGVYGA